MPKDYTNPVAARSPTAHNGRVLYLLHEQFQLSLWVSWGMMGTIFTILGIVFAIRFNRLFDDFDLVPNKTLTAIKENLTWTHKK